MSATTQATNAFDQIQVGKLVYLNNYYDYISQQGTIQWNVPCGQNLAFGCWEDPDFIENGETCKLCYNVPATYDTFEQGDPLRRVRAFPAILLGSLNGRDSSWGVTDKTGCSQTGVLAQSGRCGNSKVYDMRDVASGTNLPSKVPDINNASICFDYNPNCEGVDTGVDNLFLDSYLHYIGNANDWPTGYDPSWGDLNKINGNKTSVWNINVWFCNDVHPNGPATTNWTGGSVMLNSFTLPSGQQISVNCKHERAGNTYNGSCSGGFFYIGIILNPPVCNGVKCLNYKEILDYVSSQTFKDHVLNSVQCKQIWDDLGNPPFVVDEPTNYVLDGLMLGNEVWHSPDNQITCNCFDEVSFVVNSSPYGKFSAKTNDACPDCNSIDIKIENQTIAPNNQYNIDCGESVLVSVAITPPNDVDPLNLWIDGVSDLGEFLYQGFSQLANGKNEYTWRYTANSSGCNGLDQIILNWSPTGAQANCNSCNLFQFNVADCENCDNGGSDVCFSLFKTIQVGQTCVVMPTNLSINATSIDSVLNETSPNVVNITSINQDLTLIGTQAGNTTILVSLDNGINCEINVQVENTTNNQNCIDCNDYTISILNSTIDKGSVYNASCGEFIEIQLNFPNSGSTPLELFLVEDNNIGELNYQTNSINGNDQIWVWSFEAGSSGCESLTNLSLHWSDQGPQAGCPICDLFTVAVEDCPDCITGGGGDCSKTELSFDQNGNLVIFNPNQVPVTVSEINNGTSANNIAGLPATLAANESQTFTYSEIEKICIETQCI